MPTIAEMLQEARDLIAKVGWCQRHSAVNVRGRGLLEEDAEVSAVAYCVTGATDQVAWRHQVARLKYKINGMLRKAGGIDNGLVEWNDRQGRTKEHVLELFDHAIALAKKEPQDDTEQTQEATVTPHGNSVSADSSERPAEA